MSQQDHSDVDNPDEKPLNVHLPADLAEQLRAWCRREGVSLKVTAAQALLWWLVLEDDERQAAREMYRQWYDAGAGELPKRRRKRR
jgi:hypothetical protein